MGLASTTYRLARAAGLPALMRLRNRRQTPILMYHGFTRDEYRPDHFEPLHIEEQDFRRHLEFLAKHYRVIPLRELVDARSNETEPTPGSLVITMDDGYAGVHDIAAPLLEEFGLPATVFLCTDFVNGTPVYHDRVEYAVKAAPRSRLRLDEAGLEAELDLGDEPAKEAAYRAIMTYLKDVPQLRRDTVVEAVENAADAKLELSADTHPDYRPMSWADAARLHASSLFEIGNHTQSHLILGKCDAETTKNEVQGAHDELKKRLGFECDLFCYPNGNISDFNDASRSILIENGYRCALTTVQRATTIQDDLFELPRYFARDDVYDMEASISGLTGLIKFVLQPLRHGVQG